MVVSGEILPEDQAQQLRDAGADLFFYSWATGEYIDDPTQLDPSSWQAEVWANRSTWLLNPAHPTAGRMISGGRTTTTRLDGLPESPSRKPNEIRVTSDYQESSRPVSSSPSPTPCSTSTRPVTLPIL